MSTDQLSYQWPILVLIGVVGLLVGSFLNVVIYRVPREESIAFPSSHCPSCQQPIKAWHNVPVLGWLVLRGHCARCGDSISARYPLVEGGTAALFVAITLRFGLSVQLPAYLYLAAVGVVLAAIDFDVRLVPDAIVLPSYVVSVLLLMPAGAAHADWTQAQRAMIGMIALCAIHFAVAMAFPTGLGLGDVKLAGLLGLYLGWLSWGAILVGAFGGFVLGAASLVVVRNRHHLVAIAYGPCLIAAAGLAIFVTAPLGAWYGSVVAAT